MDLQDRRLLKIKPGSENQRVLADIAFFVLTEQSALAGSFTYQREFKYEAITREDGVAPRTRVLEKVRRLILEELMTYLEDETEIRQTVLKGEQLSELAQEVLHTEIVEERWEGKTYYLRAKIVGDPRKLEGSADFFERLREKLESPRAPGEGAEQTFVEAEGSYEEIGAIETESEIRDNQKRTLPRPTTTDWLRKGASFWNERDFEGAVDAFTRAIELEADCVTAYLNRGSSYFRSGRYARAIEDFNRVLELEPENSVGYNNRGSALIETGEPDQAIDDYSRAITLNLPCPEAYYNRGIAYLKYRSDYQSAIEDFDKFLELRPNDFRGYVNRGVSLGKTGRMEEAIRDYGKAAALNDRNAAIFFNRGNAFLNLGNYKAAIKDYSRAIQLEPDHIKPYYNRAIAYGKMGDPIHAIADYDKVIEGNPGDARAHVRRGFHYARIGYEKKAIEDWRRAAQLGDDTGLNYLGGRGIEY